MLSLRGGAMFSPRRDSCTSAEGRTFLLFLFICLLWRLVENVGRMAQQSSCLRKLLSQGGLRVLGEEIVVFQFLDLI
jgi:hypothetical protein